MDYYKLLRREEEREGYRIILCKFCIPFLLFHHVTNEDMVVGLICS